MARRIWRDRVWQGWAWPVKCAGSALTICLLTILFFQDVAAQQPPAQRIGVTLANLDFPFVQALADSLRRAAADTGVELELLDAEGDPQRQLDQINDLAGRELDAIIVNPLLSDDGLKISRIAERAALPLVFVNQQPVNAAILPAGQTYVGSDETVSGRLQTEEICRRIIARGGDGGAEILLLIGALTTHAARIRSLDVLEALERPVCAGIRLRDSGYAEWEREPARKLTEGWLAGNPPPAAIIANNDSMALGALDAIRVAGLPPGEILLAGIDATPEALQAMAEGALEVTVYQDAEGQARAALEAARALIAGEAVPSRIDVPFALVTPETLSHFRKGS